MKPTVGERRSSLAGRKAQRGAEGGGCEGSREIGRRGPNTE